MYKIYFYDLFVEYINIKYLYLLLCINVGCVISVNYFK